MVIFLGASAWLPVCHTAVMAMHDVVAEHRCLDDPDHIAVHHWTVEAVRRPGIGAQHVSVNTQESLDQKLARFVELGVMVGEQPVAWMEPLSIQLDFDRAAQRFAGRGPGSPTCYS